MDYLFIVTVDNFLVGRSRKERESFMMIIITIILASTRDDGKNNLYH